MILTPAEQKNSSLSDGTLTKALRHLREAGFVILERALPLGWVDEMRVAFEEEGRRCDPPEDGRGGIAIRFEMPFLDPLAVENPFGLQIIEAVLGTDIWSIFPYHTNTTWPGAGKQHIHRDTCHLFPELPYALPPSLLIVHIPLVDFSDENGSTEVWPGSHLITDSAPDSLESKEIEERALALPSIRTNMPAGSVVVRDMRIWHRGMPNNTETVRTMLSIVYFRQFHRYPDHLVNMGGIPALVMDQLPPRAKSIYRYHPIKESDSHTRENEDMAKD
jgi:hypothetical protein